MNRGKDNTAADRKRIEQLAKKAGLAAKPILAAAKTAIELVPESLGLKGNAIPTFQQLAAPQSRFGGAPDFHEGDDEWPETYTFVAQVNLGEIGYYVGAEHIPMNGLVSFFVVDGEDDDGDYLGTGYVQHDAYEGNETFWRLPVPKKGVRVLPCSAMTFIARLTLPHPGTNEAKALKLTADQATAYNDIVYAGYAHPVHQLFGCKNTDLDGDANEVLVLSLASDKKLGMKWGDDNRLNFHIKKTHFAKAKLGEAYPAYVDA
ncbi:MAG TPA: DUF1963 domain-containing protein [Kofleriaceae bacterium]|nr:DUF1963 domain-containing protein [Kofleriaceae bacterium]